MVVLPAEAVGAKGAWWSNSVSSSSGRQRRVVGAGRTATAAAAEKGISVMQDGHSTTRSRRYDFAAVAAGTGAVVVTEDGISSHEVSPHRKAAAVVTKDGSSTHEVPPHRVTHKYGKKTTQPLVTVLSSSRESLPYCDLVCDGYGDINWNPTQCFAGDTCPNYPTDMERGICETTGTPNDVLPYLNHKEIIPGQIYYGLDFNDHSFEGRTYTPHNGSCRWGKGSIVGQCKRNGNCPSTQKKIVQAWQECAKLCNDAPKCHTFTVRTQAYWNTRYFYCYFHKSYECKSNHAGIDNYAAHNVKDDNLGVWSGICRTRSGRSNDYACTNTPIP